MVQISLGGTSMQRIMIILLTIVSGSALYGAELVGDFAPLEVGNQWVYQYFETPQQIYLYPVVHFDTLLLVRQLNMTTRHTLLPDV